MLSKKANKHTWECVYVLEIVLLSQSFGMFVEQDDLKIDRHE